MGKKQKQPAPLPSPPSPRIYEASLGANGAVVKGQPITQAQAEARRQSGEDVLVGGGSIDANRSLARTIEQNANGAYKRCPPHAQAGPNALPHFQPFPRPPAGHTFYETAHCKAR